MVKNRLVIGTSDDDLSICIEKTDMYQRRVRLQMMALKDTTTPQAVVKCVTRLNNK